MIQASKILEENSRYQRFLAGEKAVLTEDEIYRQTRYHHALEMIKQYSPSHTIAKKVHKDRFRNAEGKTMSDQSVELDFLIASQLLGKEGMFSKDFMKNFLIHKGMKALTDAFEKEKSELIPKLLRELYLLAGLDKVDVEMPDFKNYVFPELRFMPHPDSIEMKNSPQILEEFIRDLMKPKSNLNFEEAKVVDED